MAATYYANPAEAEDFAAALLRAGGGLPQDEAQLMAKCLVQADLRGVDTHGLARLQQYMTRVKDGLINPTPKLEFEEKTPVAAHLDGQNAFGFIVATKAMADAVRRAETYGIGIVTANHSNHFGMAATYVQQALEKGMISLVFTNSAKQMPPFGGVETLLGISPFAAGAPSEKEVPFILDMAPSVVAKGKIRKAARRGESIPLGWAYDKDGKPTTDAEVALNGSMAPIGGPKGSGIAILMDIMSGVLGGAAFGGEVGDQYKETRPQNVGHTFIAIKPGTFVDAATFRERMDTLVQRVHNVKPAEGFDRVLFPGEPEYLLSVKRRKEGLSFADAERKMFEQLQAEFGVKPLSLSETPLNLTNGQ